MSSLALRLAALLIVTNPNIKRKKNTKEIQTAKFLIANLFRDREHYLHIYQINRLQYTANIVEEAMLVHI